MMQESPRLPPMLNSSWTPTPTISSSSVGGVRCGTGKRARGTEILNGHHGKPRSNVHSHPHHHQLQQSTSLHNSSNNSPHRQSSVPSPVSPVQTSPQQPSLPPQPPTPLRDTSKLQGTPKRSSSGALSVSSPEASSPSNQAKNKDLWGGWLGTTLSSPKSRNELNKLRSSSSPLQNSELRTSGFDMTKLYPELSAKLGLTKPVSSETSTPTTIINSNKNGLALKDHLNSGCLKRLEHVTDDSRIKIISSGQILSNTKGLLSTKVGNGVQMTKSTTSTSNSSCNSTSSSSSSSTSSSHKSSKQRHKSCDVSSRKDGYSRSSVHYDHGDKGVRKDNHHNRARVETSSDKSNKRDSHSRSSGRTEGSDRSISRKDHGRSNVRLESSSSGTIHTSHGGSIRSPSKGPSLYSNRSSGISITSTTTTTTTTITSIRNSANASIPSSILEEQLRGGTCLRQPQGLSSNLNSSHLPKLLESGVTKSVTSTSSTFLSTTSPSSCNTSRTLVMAPATYPPSVAAHQPRVVTLPPKRLPLPISTHATAASLPESLLRVHTLREKQYAYNSDLFPLGVETSEESDISDVDDLCGNQQGWIDPTTEDVLDVQQNVASSTLTDLSHFSAGSNCQRSVILAAALASHRRQVQASRLRSEVRAWEVNNKFPLANSLVKAARIHPRLTSSTCSQYHPTQINQESPKVKNRFKSSVLLRRVCVYNDGKGKGECGDPSLPGTRHCQRHIMYNVDQLLYTHCTARLPDNTLCRVPVFDMSHELPLCNEHSKKKDNSVKTNFEETSKPKRPRKKNKMPILSRYGKRSKKRRRSSNSASSIIPSTCVRPPMASQSSLSSPQPSPSTPQTSPHFSTTSCTDSLAEGEESELDDDMEVMVEGLYPRDLQDVLNRIPENELTELFYAPENKSGEFDNNSDEKEEIEVHKDYDEVRRHVSSHPLRSVTATNHNNIIATSSSSTTTMTTSTSLPLTEEGTTLSLDENTLNELVAGNIPIDSIISSSFNQQELNTISQALSNIVQESNINLAGFDLSAASENSNFPPSSDATSSGSVGAVVDVSDSSLMSQASDATGQVEFSEADTSIKECKVNLLNQRPGLVTDTATLSPLK